MTELLTAFGLSGAAGLNAYIPLLTVGALGRAGVIHLSAPFDALTNGWILGLIVALLIIEIAVDKIPGFDHVNDIVMTFVRPAAGAVLFGASTGAIGDVPSWLAIGAGVVMAFSVHAAKATARPVINAATVGTGAPVISTVEDVISVAASFAAVLLPWLVVAFLIALVIGIVWLLRRRRAYSRASHGQR